MGEDSKDRWKTASMRDWKTRRRWSLQNNSIIDTVSAGNKGLLFRVLIRALYRREIMYQKGWAKISLEHQRISISTHTHTRTHCLWSLLKERHALMCIFVYLAWLHLKLWCTVTLYWLIEPIHARCMCNQCVIHSISGEQVGSLSHKLGCHFIIKLKKKKDS